MKTTTKDCFITHMHGKPRPAVVKVYCGSVRQYVYNTFVPALDFTYPISVVLLGEKLI